MRRIGVLQENELPSGNQQLAQQRTDWAFERTKLANQRTLVAWLRTGLAVVGFGSVIPRLLDNVEPAWLVNLIAVIFVVSGTMVLFFSMRSYREMTSKLESELAGMPWWLVTLLVICLEVGAILILILFVTA